MRRSQLLTFFAFGVLLTVPLRAQVGLGNGRDVLMTSAIGAGSHSEGAKLVDDGDLLELRISSPGGTLVGSPLFLVGELRNRADDTVIQVPGEPNALGVGSGLFFLVDSTQVSPAVWPGSWPLAAGPLTFSSPLPDLALMGVSLWVQAGVIDPYAANGLALSRTVRHDGRVTPQSSAIDDLDGIPASLLGYGVATGDLNGDGFDEVIVGQPGSDVLGLPAAGEVLILYGPDQVLRTTLTATLPVAGAWFGNAVRVGDVTGDGVPDLIVGARMETEQGFAAAGAAHVFVGPSLSTQIRLVAPTLETNSRFGHAIATTDWNGDGLDDLVVSAPKATSGGWYQAGQVHIFLAPGLTSPITLEAPVPQWGSKFGYALAAADVNRDGKGDLAVGAPFQDQIPGDDAGAGYVFVAPMTVAAHSFTQPGSEDALIGNAAATADFNGDGYPDVAFGAEFDDESGFVDGGSVHVFYGPHFAAREELVSPGAGFEHGFGSDIASADVNYDGFGDLVVGEFWTPRGGYQKAGRGWVLYGPLWEQATELLPGLVQSYGQYGRRVTSGDTDGDGFAEAVLSAPFADPVGPANLHEGEITIFRY